MSLELPLKNLELNFKVRNPEENRTFEFENFRLDAATKLLYRSGEQVVLTPKAVDTLIALVESNGKVVAKDELMQKIWADTIVEESNLAQYLHVLRKTLGETSDGKPYIETLKRRGYRFNGAVRVLKNANRFSPSFEEAGTRDKASNGKPKAADLISQRFERRGNVLAVADWVEIAEKPKPVDIERPAPATDQSFVRGLALAGTAAAILLALVAFNWFRTPAVAVDQAQTANGGLTITPLTNAESVEQATISPDGKYFAYVEYGNNSSRIWLQQVGESSRIETVDHFNGRIFSLAFTPDSASVYFLAWRDGEKVNSLYRVGALGGVPARVLTDIYGPVSFSPDASEITFVRTDPKSGQTQLVIAASDGSRERALLARDGASVILPNPAWSPDGKQIAVGLMRSEKSITFCSIVGVALSDETVTPLSGEKWDSCHRMAWLSDGSGLVFIGTSYNEALTTRRDQVYHLSPESGSSQRLTNSGDRHDAWSLGVSDANRILALPLQRVSHIWSLEMGADAQMAKQITTGQSDGRGGVESLSDESIFYMSRSGDGFGIFRTSFDDRRDARAIAADQTMEELRASPDGRFLVFAAKVGGYGHLFRVNSDGTDRQQLTFGENNQTDSTVSPDGRWIVYASYSFDGDKTRHSLRKIPASGGDPIDVVSELCKTPHFSIDGRMISCIEGELIRVVSFDTGETVKTFKAAGIPILNSGARWTPDGQNLVYRVMEKDVVNLWLQPLDGGYARPLTNFSHGYIYNFAFTPDGSRIYLARGNLVRNVVLIKGI